MLRVLDRTLGALWWLTGAFMAFLTVALVAASAAWIGCRVVAPGP
jgi:hypothetical protein